MNDLLDVNELSHDFTESLFSYFDSVPKMKMMTPAEVTHIVNGITEKIFEPIIDELIGKGFLQRVTGVTEPTENL